MAKCHLLVLALCLCFSLMVVECFDGCKMHYGRRGCQVETYTGVLVTCDGQGDYAEIPPVIPSDTVYISLTNFRFGVLMRANFTRFKMVQCMSLIDSDISGVEFDTFGDMESLQELTLENTNIGGSGNELEFINHPDFKPIHIAVTDSPMITSVSFSGTVNMEKITGLNLRGNSIRSIEPSLFSFLKNLVSLDLSDNELNDLEWDKLSQMTNLNKLSINGNNLQNIPIRVYRTFFAVNELKIAGNPFHCNCNLHWLKNFYKETTDRIVDLDKVQCVSPAKTFLIKTPDSKFGCSKPSLPKIEWHTLDGIANHYAFNCSSSADPAPTLTFQFPDDMKLITPPSDNLAKLKTSTPRVISKPGAITCIATNSEGSRQAAEFLDSTGAASNVVMGMWYILLAVAIAAGLSSRRLQQ